MNEPELTRGIPLQPLKIAEKSLREHNRITNQPKYVLEAGALMKSSESYVLKRSHARN